jgi:hypothetical protein
MLAIGSWIETGLPHDWVGGDFMVSQLIEAVGLACAITEVIAFAVANITPAQAAAIATTIQIARWLGSEIGSAVIQTFVRVREQVYSNLIGLHVVTGLPATAQGDRAVGRPIRQPRDGNWRACRARDGGARQHCAPRGLCAGLHRRVLADCVGFAARYSARAPAAPAAAEPTNSIARSLMTLWLILVEQPGPVSSRNSAGKAQRPTTVIGGRFPSVDAPFQARENVGVVAARGRMLSSVRPGCGRKTAAGLYGSSRRKSTCPAASAPCTWNTCFAMSKPIVLACSTDASFGRSSTPSPWHKDAVGGRPPHHPTVSQGRPAQSRLGVKGGCRRQAVGTAGPELRKYRVRPSSYAWCQ